MPQASICRMCLVTDVQMVVIAGTPLQFLYEKITEAELLENMKPVAACYICHAMLRRCQNFITKSVRADELLTDFLINNKLTVKAVARIDRKAYNLNHTLGTKVECHDNTPSEEDDAPKVKQETSFEFVGDGDHDMDFEDHTEFPLNEPVVEINEKTLVQPEAEYLEIQFMKEEKEPIVSDGDDNRDVDSEDEQPLTKVKAARPGRPGRPAKRKNDDEDWKPDTGELKQANEELKQEPVEKKPKKQGPKPKKRKAKNLKIIQGEATITAIKRIHSLERLVLQRGEKRFVCQFCKKVLRYKTLMQTHLKEHRPYECDVCHKRFNRTYHVRVHVETHTDEKPFECDICHLKLRGTSFKTHLRTHTGEKRYQCYVCGKRFHQSNNIKRHLLIHSGEMPHECDVCHRRFNQLCNLRTHVKKHTEKCFECDVCGSKIGDKKSLRIHIKTQCKRRYIVYKI